MKQTVQLPAMSRSAHFRAQSFDEASNTIDVVWTSETPVRRSSWMDGDYDEQLLCAPENVRLGRLNSGAAFLDSHDSYSLGSVIGSVVPDSARMEGQKGLATVLLSRAAGAADTIQNIKDGVIRNISVGYLIHAATRTERDGAVPLLTATDWEPVEISAVPVPADPTAQIRSALRGGDVHPCLITRADPGITKEPIVADKDKPAPAGTEKDKAVEPVQAPDPNAGKAGDGIQDKKPDPKLPATSVTDPGDASALGPADLERQIAEAVRRGVSDERERIAEIQALATRSGVPDLAAEHVRAGTKLKAFRGIVLDRLVEERAKDGGPTGTAAIGERSLAPEHGDHRAAGEAMARRLLGKTGKAA